MGYNWCELDLRKQLICCIRAGSDHSLSAMNSGTWGPKCRYNLHCWADNIVVTGKNGETDPDPPVQNVWPGPVGQDAEDAA